MTEEIPIWVDGSVHWLSGADRRTTCRDVLELFSEGAGGGGDINNFVLVERWREVERPLDMDSRLLKIWSHWGNDKKDVRLCLRRLDNEADSGRGSPVGATPSLRRKRNRAKPKFWNQQEGLHPKRLAELSSFERAEYADYPRERLDEEELTKYVHGEKIYTRTHEADRVRRKGEHKTCSTLHSTVIDGKQKKCCSKRSGRPRVRNSENIEKLMKLILAQGSTIQTQLQKLKEREGQIETMEVKRHKEREEKNGRNYLLETYLKSLKEAEVPATDEEKGNDSGVHTEAGSERTPTGSEVNKDTESGRLDCLDFPKRLSSRDKIKQGSKREVNESFRPARSRSESRNDESHNHQTHLKRTHSENDLTECIGAEKISVAETKEENNEVVELRRVQSQVEMWEKVLRINKKLEREEENLVRLHIQIRRIQSENIKLVKDDNYGDPKAQTLQQQLECLRNDLDQNSKEIYNNFTQLINDDEQVVKKQNHLAELMSDIDRTEKEHEMLSEMVAANSVSESAATDDDIGIIIQVKGQEKVPTHLDLTPNVPSLDFHQSDQQNQRLEKIDKPKNVKISFDENIQDSTAVDKIKEPSPEPARNIKGILKNRNSETFYISDLEKVPASYGSNISFNDACPKISPKPSPLQQQASMPYAHPMNTAPLWQPSISSGPPFQRREAIYVPGSPPNEALYRQVPGAPSSANQDEETFLRANSATPTGFPVVTIKAVVHNDTDSTGSSDTSGLSSMYSASPTVDEPSYVLNTLV